jgi:hypothetical protein|tara:strand:+ start:697 stop:1377 length:681 start_codon:yes stop_codon:yes gene_type:complete
MKKQLDIVVPQSWSAVNLENYLKLQKDLVAYGTDDEIAYVATLLYHLCGVEPGLIPKLPTNILTSIKTDLRGFMGDASYDLQRIIKVNGKEYGFEPNLSKMAYGAYLDITKYENITIDKNWNKIMSVLYRPVTSKTLNMYEIESYDSKKTQPELFDSVGMDVHFGTMFFFLRTLAELVNDTLSFSKEEEVPPAIKSILERNGEVIKQLFNFREMISPSSMISLAGH